MVGCNSNQISKKKNVRFKNAEFISVLDSMMKNIQPNTIHPENFSATFFTTENHIYVTLMNINCAVPPYYQFQQKIDSILLPIYINGNSVKPERFFDLSDLNVTKLQDDFFYCDDYYAVNARLDVKQNKIQLEKMIKPDDKFDSTYIAEQDSIHFKFKVKMIEPKPAMKTESNEN
jgi:hypothetical protein